ncbi:phosphate acyltransferase [bacterium]|nr:phosphate acyltransferase [bacterium]
MIAFDAMGGDHAPKEIVDGAVALVKRGRAVAVFGRKEELLSELARAGSGPEEVKIFDAPQVIGMDEPPVQAVRAKRQSSLVMALEALKCGKVSAVISAGNSGALLAAATFSLGRQPGIIRPGLVSYLPLTERGVIALDLGATVEPKSEHLVQYAQMGSEYARELFKIEKPVVGILSNGTEATKGTSVHRAAREILFSSRGMFEFIGNVEPADVMAAKVDVLVSDGFSGNIMLKTLEQLPSMATSVLPSCCDADSSNFKEEVEKFKRRWWCGGVLAGVNGFVMGMHGSANADEVAHAGETAIRLLDELGGDLFVGVPYRRHIDDVRDIVQPRVSLGEKKCDRVE